VIDRVILVVEDNDLLRGLISNAISERGFVVHSAADVTEAKRLLRDYDPDGVVLDVDLGLGLNGFDLAKLSPTKHLVLELYFLRNCQIRALLQRVLRIFPRELPTFVSQL